MSKKSKTRQEKQTRKVQKKEMEEGSKRYSQERRQDLPANLVTHQQPTEHVGAPNEEGKSPEIVNILGDEYRAEVVSSTLREDS